MNSDAVIKRLKEHFPKYTKNCNMYPIIVDKTKGAYDNAKNWKNIKKKIIEIFNQLKLILTQMFIK